MTWTRSGAWILPARNVFLCLCMWVCPGLGRSFTRTFLRSTQFLLGVIVTGCSGTCRIHIRSLVCKDMIWKTWQHVHDLCFIAQAGDENKAFFLRIMSIASEAAWKPGCCCISCHSERAPSWGAFLLVLKMKGTQRKHQRQETHSSRGAVTVQWSDNECSVQYVCISSIIYIY